VPVIIEWLTEGDGLPELDLASREHPYLIIGAFVTFDAVIPILPSQSLLNAASTLASQGDARARLHHPGRRARRDRPRLAALLDRPNRRAQDHCREDR
jgi:hypothetical protein